MRGTGDGEARVSWRARATYVDGGGRSRRRRGRVEVSDGRVTFRPGPVGRRAGAPAVVALAAVTGRALDAGFAVQTSTATLEQALAGLADLDVEDAAFTVDEAVADIEAVAGLAGTDTDARQVAVRERTYDLLPRLDAAEDRRRLAARFLGDDAVLDEDGMALAWVPEEGGV